MVLACVVRLLFIVKLFPHSKSVRTTTRSLGLVRLLMMRRWREPTGREPWFTILIDTQEKKDHELNFKEVGEAYAVLSDEKKRRMYVSGQDLEDAGGHRYQDIDPNSIFQAFFNEGMGGHGGMGAQHFNFRGPGGGGGGHQNFSFQFG